MKHFTLLICTWLMAVIAMAQTTPTGQIDKTKTALTATKVVMQTPHRADAGQSVTAIAEQPEGVVKTYKRSGNYYFEDWDGIYRAEQTGATNIVFGDGREVYVQNVLYSINSGLWMRGTLSEDGKTITIPAGQSVETYTAYCYDEELEDYVAIDGELRLCMMQSQETAEGNTFVEIPDQPIVYAIDGDVITLQGTQEDETIIGAVYTGFDEKYDINGHWACIGEYGTTFTRFNETLVALPDGLTPETFTMKTKDIYTEGNYENALVQMAFAGDEVYLGTFSTSLPEAWVKGKIEGDKIVFPSRQYIGIAYGYICYFIGAHYDIAIDEYGDQGYRYAFDDAFVFDYDAATRSLTPSIEQTAILVNANETYAYAFNTYHMPELKPYIEVAATPAAPEWYDVADFYDLEGDYCLSVYIPTTDTEGNYINPDKLYYTLYVDGAPYTFEAARYELSEDLVEVPITLTGSTFLTSSYFGNTIYLQEIGFSKLGIQSIYKGGGEEHRSPIVEYLLTDLHTAEMTPCATPAATYNLMGLRVGNGYRGLVIANGRKLLRK